MLCPSDEPPSANLADVVIIPDYQRELKRPSHILRRQASPLILYFKTKLPPPLDFLSYTNLPFVCRVAFSFTLPQQIGYTIPPNLLRKAWWWSVLHSFVLVHRQLS
jgi:hypothetical protein